MAEEVGNTFTMKKNNKAIIVILLIVVAVAMIQGKKEASSYHSTDANCEKSKESREASRNCASDCYLGTEEIAKCNDYWAIKNGHSDGVGLSWLDLNDRDRIGKYYYMYQTSCPPYSDDWSEIFFKCSEGTLTMPSYPACIENADCHSGELCDSTLKCVSSSTCNSATCNAQDGWYCDYADDELYRDYSCSGSNCIYTESQKTDCSDLLGETAYCNGATGRCTTGTTPTTYWCLTNNQCSTSITSGINCYATQVECLTYVSNICVCGGWSACSASCTQIRTCTRTGCTTSQACTGGSCVESQSCEKTNGCEFYESCNKAKNGCKIATWIYLIGGFFVLMIVVSMMGKKKK